MSGSRLPAAFIAGVPKAGTSTLARWVGAHPDAFLPPEKEVHFFDDHAVEGLDWYRERFAGPGRVPVDATPTYALRDEWLDAAMDAAPAARVVVLLRHPTDRLWSAYWYLRSMGLERRTIDRLVADELDGPGPGPRIAAGDYRALLARVDRLVPPGQLSILLQDDLASSPDEVWDGTCRFLGLDAIARPTHLGERLNPTGTLRSFHLRHWSMRLHLYRRTPRAALAIDRWNRTDRRPPPLPPALRRRLLEHYEPSVRAVEDRLGRALDHWRD